MPRAEELYCAAKDVVLAGVHLFKVSEKPIAPASVVRPVRLYLQDGPVRCGDGIHAVRQFHQANGGVRTQANEEKRSTGAYGFVTDVEGTVTHWFSPKGMLFTLTYLGRRGEEAASTTFKLELTLSV